jgi:hypothetical protein
VLAAGLALAIVKWRHGRRIAADSVVLIDFEGHGREEIVPGADLTRTVGWFTSMYPARLDPGAADWPEVASGGAVAGAAVRRVTEQLWNRLSAWSAGRTGARRAVPHSCSSPIGAIAWMTPPERSSLCALP